MGCVCGCVCVGGYTRFTFAFRNSPAGDIAKLRLPVGTKELNLYGCSEVTGDIEQLQLPAGMKELNLGSCYDLTGKARLSERHAFLPSG